MWSLNFRMTTNRESHMPLLALNGYGGYGITVHFTEFMLALFYIYLTLRALFLTTTFFAAFFSGTFWALLLIDRLLFICKWRSSYKYSQIKAITVWPDYNKEITCNYNTVPNSLYGHHCYKEVMALSLQFSSCKSILFIYIKSNKRRLGYRKARRNCPRRNTNNQRAFITLYT